MSKHHIVKTLVQIKPKTILTLISKIVCLTMLSSILQRLPRYRHFYILFSWRTDTDIPCTKYKKDIIRL